MLSFCVRHLLSSMDTTQRANLKKLLPKKLVMPEAATGKYPAAPTQTASSSATATATATSTGTFTAIPSTNITVVYVQTTDTSIQKGYAAAIGLSSVFGFVILCVCCGIAIRRRPAKPDEIVRQVTTVERRKSVVEEGKERRKSTLEIRTVTDTKN